MVRLIGSFPFESVGPYLAPIWPLFGPYLAPIWPLFGRGRARLLATRKTTALGAPKVDRSELRKCDSAEAEPSVRSLVSWCWYLTAPERFRRLQTCRLAL